MSKESLVATWNKHARVCLLGHLHADVIPMILGYAATISFEVVRVFGSQGKGDGQFKEDLGGLAASETRKELFVSDVGGQRIQVFHLPTGRFLRAWGGVRNPGSLALSDDSLFVADHSNGLVQRFSLDDAKGIDTWEVDNPVDICVIGEELYLTRRDHEVVDNKVYVYSFNGLCSRKTHWPEGVHPEKLCTSGDELFVLCTAHDAQSIWVLTNNRKLKTVEVMEHYELDLPQWYDSFKSIAVHGEQVFLTRSRTQTIYFNRGHARTINEQSLVTLRDLLSDKLSVSGNNLLVALGPDGFDPDCSQVNMYE
jgi:hypothetical protein